jgi:VanZ family protein
MKILRIVPMLAVMGTIFWLSHLPGDALNYTLPLHADKIAHAFIYGILAAACFPSLTQFSKKVRPLGVALIAVAICLAYGVSDELHQAFVPGRSPSFADIIADLAGGALVVGIWYWKHSAKNA